MSDGWGTVGVLVAGGALLFALVVLNATPWGGVLVATALGGFLASSGRRHGRVGAGPFAAIAGISGVVLAGGGVAAFAAGDPGSTLRLAGGVIALLGIGDVVVGVAALRDIGVERMRTLSGAVLLAIAIGVGGLLLGSILATFPLELAGLVGLEVAGTGTYVANQLGLVLGFVIVTAIVALTVGGGRGYVDIERPTRVDGIVVVLGTLAILLAAAGFQLAMVAAGVEFAPHEGYEEQLVDAGAGLLVLGVVFAYVTAGLGEELLYRNGVQKYLSEWFDPAAAIVLASAIFAAIHLPAYGDPSGLATLASVFIVFVLALILGYAYHRTENVLVPAAIHGTYNAILWLGSYWELLA